MGGESASPAVESPAGFRLLDSPILLLVCFHKAMRAELAELHLLAESGRPGWNGVRDLMRRFQFLHVVYKYHCTAEDEVIFRALDLRGGNEACACSLEHGTINVLFESVFRLLEGLMHNDCTSSQLFQELVYCTETLKRNISQHMQKEEEQVFPLLIQRFSFKEQASLVWQFISSVPVVFLGDALPWMVSYLSSGEQSDVLNCIKEAVPKDKLLQEVVVSWFGRKTCPSYRFHTAGQEEYVCSSKQVNLKDMQVRQNKPGQQCCQSKSDHTQSASNKHLVHGLGYWHGAIKKELAAILEELQGIRRSKMFVDLSSISSRILFITDILIFYSDALEKVIFPALSSGQRSTVPYRKFPEESRIGCILCLLQNVSSNGKFFFGLVEKLCLQLDSLMEEINLEFHFQASKVFPLICTTWDHDIQIILLCASIQFMPLGLLKCVVVWLSAQLTEEEAKTLLSCVKLAGLSFDTAFTTLLYEWLSVGYAGKSSLELFRKELEEMFKNRRPLPPAKIIEEGGTSSDVLSSRKTDCGEVEADCADKTKNLNIQMDKSCNLWLCADPSCLNPHNRGKCSASYSSRINQQIFLSGASRKAYSFSGFLGKEIDGGADATSLTKPIDHIFQFHKCMEDDLEYFVQESAKMVDNLSLHSDFYHHFRLVQALYEAHSNSEDEVIFPALVAKGALQDMGVSYTTDHQLEAEHFRNISSILDKLYESQDFPPGVSDIANMDQLNQGTLESKRLHIELHGMCKSMQVTLNQHMRREEIGIWPLVLEHFTEAEQEKLIGDIMGRTRAEILQTLIPRLMEYLTPTEQQIMTDSWYRATKKTMFAEWLKEWLESDNHKLSIVDKIAPFPSPTSVNSVCLHLTKGALRSNPLSDGISYNERSFICGNFSNDNKNDDCGNETSAHQNNKNGSTGALSNKAECLDETWEHEKGTETQENCLTMDQEDTEAAIRKFSQDCCLDPQQKTRLIQNFFVSRWLACKGSSCQEVNLSSNNGTMMGQSPSYRDSLKFIYGCKHYKRNCKLLAACCNRLFTCRYCHDDASDHSMDGNSVTEMMCMKCLCVQPIGQQCANNSCNTLMSKYFCKICKLFDDERQIYHCPFCNLCRVGKGLGLDYFHCMNCNACMSKSLSSHICREKCFESDCPICCEDIFTSRSPVKALSCGHLMHSTCFQEYTRTNYTCPICSKSLGDMQVYFGMLDALLAEEKMPEQHQGQTQGILCNDCGKRGSAPFHWLYHKCPHCGSYNTRLL